MLSWIKRLFGRRDRGRLIFCYFDGRRDRWADPIVIDRGIQAACPDLKSLLLLLQPLPTDLPGGLPEQFRVQAEVNREKALASIVAGVRKVFGVEPLDLDGNGLTETECVSLLADFQEFVAELVNEARPTSSSPDSSEPRPADSTPESLAGSTSPETPSTSDGPKSSPAASPACSVTPSE